MKFSLALLALAVPAVSAQTEYGADMTMPMLHPSVSTNYDYLPHNVNTSVPTPPDYKDMPVQPLGDRQSFYDNYMQGCRDFYGPKAQRCDDNEVERVSMTQRQVQSMVNYTKTGFRKIKAPDAVFKLLKEFWEKNKNNTYVENWPAGNTYVNHWDKPSKMVSVENTQLEGGGYALKQMIWNAARDTIQEWTGQKLAECSLYGIRVYEEGAVLMPHVDRLPLVSSAIINVDQDTDEPWPLEVIGHDGKAHNVTMVPGDLVLYESHSIIHGRPFPLKGRFMANVFVHFEPIGEEGKIKYGTNDLPPYVIPGSPEESNWKKGHPGGHQIMTQSIVDQEGSTLAHRYAMEGNYDLLKNVIDKDETVVNKRDSNGWTPLHEGVRKGDLDVVKLLLERGSNVNARTDNDSGGSALYWAKQTHGKDHPVIDLLQEFGATYIRPTQRKIVHTEL